MTRHISIFLTTLLPALIISACSKPQNETRYLADDFFVTVVPKGSELKTVRSQVRSFTREACEAALAKAVCETNASANEIGRNYGSIECSKQSSQYVPALMEIYDETPELMRASLCSLDRVFLSDQIPSTAFASSVTDSFGRRIGGFIGMRRQTFLKQPGINAILSWKEQLAFGGSTEFLANDPKLVQLDYGLKMSTLKSDGLFYVLMHELGHLIDYNNKVNSDRRATEWSRLSWDQRTGKPYSQSSFFQRDGFCYYDCKTYLHAADASEIYSSLQKSAFITTYSSQNPWEDFAEFWTWRLLIENKSPNYVVDVPGQTRLEMNSVFTQNQQIRAKLDFVEGLWKSPNLKVDNRRD